MSRALEKDLLVAFLESSDPRPAYNAISQVLASPPTEGLLEIEILGRSHPLPAGTHLLRDGNAVAVSKLSLVQAFLVARQVLNRYLEKGSDTPRDDGLGATAVLLLMDPEHLTAANTRKRIVKAQEADPDALQACLRREKLLIDSFVTSRLHRHTKSPTLWGHRRWLLTMFKTFDLGLEIQDDLINIIGVAAERHPRNYYAWCHARWLIGHVLEADQVQNQQDAVLQIVKDWTFKHHTDVSGWSFLSFLLDGMVPPPHAGKSRSAVFLEALELAASLHWTNESAWFFLRTMAAFHSEEQDEIKEFQKVRSALKASVSDGSPEQKMLDSADTWCRTYRDQKR